ncbi:hypothetical protein QFZ61_002848 [Arthrobacter sp. B3I4]|nr:hypothetical protein [Arthrobacter sp. B3I4]
MSIPKLDHFNHFAANFLALTTYRSQIVVMGVSGSGAGMFRTAGFGG